MHAVTAGPRLSCRHSIIVAFAPAEPRPDGDDAGFFVDAEPIDASGETAFVNASGTRSPQPSATCEVSLPTHYVMRVHIRRVKRYASVH
jgi:hypothetical protein